MTGKLHSSDASFIENAVAPNLGLGRGMNARPNFRGWVTACIPHYSCRRYLPRAVDSLLAQTYPWVRIIVVNDGDPNPPWTELAHIRDPRLTRFDLPSRMGPYFALEVAREATPDPFFLIQDADDWSAPDRVRRLLDLLVEENADFAVSAQPQFREGPYGESQVLSVRWDGYVTGRCASPFKIDLWMTPEYRLRLPHHGLFRSGILGRLGGYYGGHYVGLDKFLLNLVIMTGHVAWTPLPLYYRLIRDSSLTYSRETGYRSAYHACVERELAHDYQIAFSQYAAFRAGVIGQSEFEVRLGELRRRKVDDRTRHLITAQVGRLRGVLKGAQA
ncbi:MAG TPA: glycosyltransferase family 2 protein [Caulobacteraceae bacterium]